MFKYIIAILLLSFPAYCADYEVAFSPHRGATDLVVSEIARAKASVHVAAYGFTSAPIIAALCAAKDRGLDVRVVLDKTSHSPICGLKVRWDRHYAIMHNKIMVIDGDVTELGSFNFTASAENRNAENVICIHDAGVAAKYDGEWNRLWDESAQGNN